MNVTFKPIGKREREWLKGNDVRGIPDPRGGFGRGSVVTIDGFIVLALGYHGQVIYQDGSDAIPDLIRAARRITEAMGSLSYEDWQRIKRKGASPMTVEEILRDAF